MRFQGWDPGILGDIRIRVDPLHDDQITRGIRLVLLVDWFGVIRTDEVSDNTDLVIICRASLMGQREIVGFHDSIMEKEGCNLGGSEKVSRIGELMELIGVHGWLNSYLVETSGRCPSEVFLWSEWIHTRSEVSLTVLEMEKTTCKKILEQGLYAI